MKLFLIAALLAPAAQANSGAQLSTSPTFKYELSPSCKAKLTKGVVKAELAFLAAKGETLASEFETQSYVNSQPNRDYGVAVVALEDPADGRSVRYKARVSPGDVADCAINLVRDDETYCRYSTGEGPDALNDLPGLKFVSGDNIEAKGPHTELQTRQVRAFLGKEEADKSLEDLIGQTDDGYLSTGTLTTQTGTYDYFGAYGGDNPYGVFFFQGTTKEFTQNGDGFICLP